MARPRMLQRRVRLAALSARAEWFSGDHVNRLRRQPICEPAAERPRRHATAHDAPIRNRAAWQHRLRPLKRSIETRNISKPSRNVPPPSHAPPKVAGVRQSSTLASSQRLRSAPAHLFHARPHPLRSLSTFGTRRAATIDRVLVAARLDINGQRKRRKGVGAAIRHSVPVRTFEHSTR